ncbi:hypothetical protein BD413DRAFT_474368, partial [Trametes elegans]
GGQRFVSRSPEKTAEIRSFIQSLRFQASPSTPPQPSTVVVYAPEMKHLGDKNRFGQPWTYFVELGPGTSMLRDFLLWQGVFAVHPTLSFSMYAIREDIQPWSIMVLSGPPGAVEDSIAAKRAVLTVIKERLWADRGFLWFTARQVAANWNATGTLAELVKMATDTLDAMVVTADDPSTGRAAPAYLITGKPVSNARDEYKRWLNFFTTAKTFRRGLHCLTVNKLVVDCKLCKDSTHCARDCPLPKIPGWQGTSVDDIYASSPAKPEDGATAPDPLVQAKDIWKEVPRRGSRGGNRGPRGSRGRGGGRGHTGKGR